MLTSERRMGQRVPMEIFLNQYISDKPYRAMAGNMSETGLLIQRVKAPRAPLSKRERVIGLEFELPGTGETIWARGEICHQKQDSYFYSDRIRFTGMAQLHQRLLRDFCIESHHSHLHSLLSKIRVC